MSEPSKAVFLSYASQDAAAAKKICEELRAAGIEVWFDQSELRGGDAWDAKIRKQIKECALFVPVISPATNARPEGYFRLEWKLAVDRSHLLADDHPFLFPIVIGDVQDAIARVPEKFRDVQWTRLRLDETPKELAGRVAKLLAGGSGMEAGRPRPVQRDEDVPSPKGKPAKPAWLRTAWSVVGLVIALYYAIWPSWRKSRSHPAEESEAVAPAVSSPAPPAVSVAKPVSEISEARQLAIKARAVFEVLDSTRDDFQLAEELLKQAVAKDTTDAEIWAAYAQLHERFMMRGWDVTNERFSAAKTAAQRALRLDPQSFEARVAQVQLAGDTPRELQDSERAWRELRQEKPNDQRVLRGLAIVLRKQGRLDESGALQAESAALPGGDPIALYDRSLNLWFVGRTAEAEAAMRATIAQSPFAGALLISAWYAMKVHGDLDTAKAMIERLPPSELQEDRGCYFAFELYYLRREPDAALARLRDLPRDWINDNWYRGPKGRLAGDALQLAGRPEAAAAEWRAALKLVEARLATNPTNRMLLHNRTILLADLGERAEAEKQFAIELQMDGVDPAGDQPVSIGVTRACIALGRNSEAIRQIARDLKEVRHTVDYSAADLRLSPVWDPLRGDPEFQKVIAEAAAFEADDLRLHQGAEGQNQRATDDSAKAKAEPPAK